MKTTFLTACAALAFAWSVAAQDPTATPAAPTPPAPSAAPSVTAVSPSPDESSDDTLETRIKKRTKGVQISVNRSQAGKHDPDVRLDGKDLEDLGPLAAIPIVGIIFGSLSLFGAPVLIVSAILFFSYLKQRSLHRTVRMMVEKGQPVPAALFSAPQNVRARSDMRRGVILSAVGLGLIFFLAAANDWEGGAWGIGLIPFLMGLGYLTVWKLEGKKPALVNGTTSTVANSTDIAGPLS